MDIKKCSLKLEYFITLVQYGGAGVEGAVGIH